MVSKNREPVKLPWRRETELFTQGEDGYHTYRVPAVSIAPDGTILAFCEARKTSHYDFHEIHIALRRSTDGGVTWEPRQVIASNGDDTIGNPCVVVDRETATVWLSYCRNNTEVYVIHSSDNGLSWSDPREITADVKRDGWTWYATGPGHGIQLRSGRLMIPCNHADTYKGLRFHPPGMRSHVIYSDDHGSSWKVGGIIDAGGTSECQVAETSQGSIYMTIRNNSADGAEQDFKVRLCSRSTDDGMTWSRLSKAEGIIDPICNASVTELPNPDPDASHDLLLLANLASTGLRQNMTVRLSYDEGDSWQISKVLYPGRSGYSDLAVTADNTVLCFYCQGTNGSYVERVVLTQFNLERYRGISRSQ